MLKPEGRVILVSGATRGIGRAVVERLLTAGYAVSAGVRDLSRAPAHARLRAYHYEAASGAAAASWVESTIRDFGRIDGVVNAAGVSLRTPLIGSDEAALFASLDQMVSVNVKGPMAVVRAAWPHLAASGSGRVVNVSSLSGKRVRSDNIGYAMSKFALMALNQEIRRIGWEQGIRATALCPGFVNTDMTRAITQFPRDQMSQPEDLAELVELALRLPNNASVAELLVNCRHEDFL
jgi:NAD(P)-dependent dehydrogenase (short-subunit alcohol dehydrogenase family)